MAGPEASTSPAKLAEAGRRALARGAWREAREHPGAAADLDPSVEHRPAVKASETSGEERVRAAVAESIEPYRDIRGSYRIENVFRYLLATA